MLGWPLEWVPIVLIVVPILLPLVTKLGIDLVWFCTLVAVCLQTAWLSPPVALSAYFLKGVVPDWELKDIYAGMMQFMVLQIIGLLLVLFFPQLALWLPELMRNQENAMAASNRRVGIIGIGFGSQVYVPAFASEGWEVAALCSRHADKARKAADAAGVADVHTDPLELIGRDDIAAVGIVTPPGAHHDLSIAALKAGKHVLCEKPFALDSTQAAAMRDAAGGSGRTAMVGHEFRHTPQRAYIKELLGDGYIGRFQLCTVELFLDRYVTRELRPLTWMAYEADGGGILGALGSHYVDALRHWFGEVAAVGGRLLSLRPDVVDTSSRRVVKAETDDAFMFTLEFANGGLATMIASFAATPARGAKIVVMGDARHADRRAARTQSDGGRRGDREPQWLAAATARDACAGTCRSRMRATTA